MSLNAVETKSYQYWKELLPKNNYIHRGDTLWSAKCEQDFTLPIEHSVMKLPTISFYSFGNDIIGGNFYGSNFTITVKVKEFNKPVFDSEESGQKTIILNTKAVLGTLYVLELELRHLAPAESIINHFVLFGVKGSFGWREIFPEN